MCYDCVTNKGLSESRFSRVDSVIRLLSMCSYNILVDVTLQMGAVGDKQTLSIN